MRPRGGLVRVVILDEPAVGVEILVDGELGRIDEILPDGSWVVTFERAATVREEVRA